MTLEHGLGAWSLGLCTVPTTKAYPSPWDGFLATHFPACWCPRPTFPLSPGPHCCFCLWWGLGVPAGRLRDVRRLCRVTVLNIVVAISAPGWQPCGTFSKWPGEVGSLARSILSTSWCGGLPGTPLPAMGVVYWNGSCLAWPLTPAGA